MRKQCEGDPRWALTKTYVSKPHEWCGFGAWPWEILWRTEFTTNKVCHGHFHVDHQGSVERRRRTFFLNRSSRSQGLKEVLQEQRLLSLRWNYVSNKTTVDRKYRESELHLTKEVLKYEYWGEILQHGAYVMTKATYIVHRLYPVPYHH